MGRLGGAALAVMTTTAAALVAVTGTAAAQWRELPAYEVPDGQSALCLRAAGPGALTIAGGGWVKRLKVDADALTAADVTALGRSTFCPEPAEAVAGAQGAAGTPGAATEAGALLAGPVAISRERQRMAVGIGGAPATLTGAAAQYLSQPAVATAPSGAAVIAWIQWNEGTGPARGSTVFATVRPSASAPFTAPQAIGSASLGNGAPQAVVDDSGRAHVVWTSAGRTQTSRTLLASAAPGAPFAPGRVLASSRRGFFESGPAIAGSADGRVLIASPAGDAGVVLHELAPGAAGFTRLQRVRVAGEQLALALRADGAAVLVSREAFEEALALARRAGPGRFSRTVVLRSPDVGRRASFGRAWFVSTAQSGGEVPYDASSPQVEAALADDGALVVSWFDRADDELPAIAYAWHGNLATPTRGTVEGFGALGRGSRLSSPCRIPTALAPLQLADGGLAVAWSDDGRGDSGGGLGGEEFASGAGRVHIARPGTAAPPPATAPPRASARLIGPRTVGVAEPIAVRVRCAGGPCDVRVSAPSRTVVADGRPAGESSGSVGVVGVTTIATAGASATVRLDPDEYYGFAQPRRAARVPIALTVCRPSGEVAQRLTIRPRLRGRSLPPAPRIVGLRATRLPDGRIRASWRLSREIHEPMAVLTAELTAARRWPLDEKLVHPRGRTRFAVTLDPEARWKGNRPRRVTVSLATDATVEAASATVRIR